MIVTLLVIFVLTALSVGVYTSASGRPSVDSPVGDMRQGTYANTAKRALSAAQAGLAWYQSALGADPNYWAKCTSVPALTDGAAPVENIGDTPTPWRTIQGTNEQYVVDLLPAPGKAACDPNDPSGSMIDSTTGTFRIRVTGRDALYPSLHRSIVATFRRRGFLDFIYYTSVDAEDPNLYAQSSVTQWMAANGYQTVTPDPVNWIKTNCNTQWQNGRATARFSGTYTKSSGGGNITNYDMCAWGTIQFATADVVAGPSHTQDSILVCGNSGANGPTFGRTAQDQEELEAPSGQDVRAANGCSTYVNWKGTHVAGAPALTLPPSNTSVGDNVSPGYQFTGTTTINLGSPSAGRMTVTNTSMGLNNVNMAQPTNGVIYVANGTCGVTYDPANPYPNTPGCGDVYVKGTYNQNLTIAAEKDIIINGNLVNSGDVLLGLIGDNYVRVYHPVTSGSGCSNNGYTPPNPLTIDAAILTVTGSFLVDNYACNTLGQLNVVGAIAQKYRGIVGQGGNGYIKNYQYDDRLRFRSPPNFLDPVQSSWKAVRVYEQSPAATTTT
jgi:hypothetical protein